MSYILNVVGDIYASDRSGKMFFTTFKSPETILDVFTRNSGHYKEYQFRFRISGIYLKANSSKVIMTTNNRNDPETFFSIEDGTGRIIDKYHFKYEAIIKDLPVEKIEPNKISVAEVNTPIPPHADEKLVKIEDHKTPSNYNPAPSDPNNHWNPVINVESYTASRSDSDKIRDEEEKKSKMETEQMLMIGGGVLLALLLISSLKNKKN